MMAFRFNCGGCMVRRMSEFGNQVYEVTEPEQGNQGDACKLQELFSGDFFLEQRIECFAHEYWFPDTRWYYLTLYHKRYTKYSVSTEVDSRQKSVVGHYGLPAG